LAVSQKGAGIGSDSSGAKLGSSAADSISYGFSSFARALIQIRLMTKKDAREPQPPVVLSVFEDFIGRLQADSSIDRAAVGRLRQALVDDYETSVEILRKALFSEEPLP
jgi:hypothetical protein